MSPTQPLIAWSNDFSIGIDEIDDQHKLLFDALNRLWAAILERAGREAMMAIVEDLERYCRDHFTAEEAFMAATGYQDLAGHAAAHGLFVDRLAAEKKVVLAGGQLSLDLVKFLKDWLASHIRVSDKAYAEALRQSNQPPVEADRFFQRLRG